MITGLPKIGPNGRTARLPPIICRFVLNVLKNGELRVFIRSAVGFKVLAFDGSCLSFLHFAG